MRKVSFVSSFCALALVVGMTSSAFAQAPAAAPDTRLIKSGIMGGADLSIDGQPLAFGFMAFDPGIVLGLGLGFTYDGNLATDKTSMLGALYGFYAVKNAAPIAVGPEVIVKTTLVGPQAAGDLLIVEPGLAAYFAPFNAPVLLGFAWDLTIVARNVPPGANSSAKMTATLQTPSVRFIWAI